MGRSEDVFRFMSVRGVDRRDAHDHHLLIDIRQDREVLASSEREARGAAAPTRHAKKVAASGRSAVVAAELVAEQEISELSDLDVWLLRHDDQPELEELNAAIERIFDGTAAEVVERDQYRQSRSALGESLLTLLLSSTSDKSRRARFLRLIHVCAVLERLAEARLESPEDVRILLHEGIVLLPAALATPGTALARGPAIADLQVVRERSLRYELGDVAYIENALAGEERRRTHRSLATTSEEWAEETERDVEESRDLQTADRFQLQRESEEILNERMSLEAGLAVSASYGPTVSVAANMDFALETSREESNRTATSFGRDVTESASSRARTREWSRRAGRRTTEVEETNEHAIDNSEGEAHNVGIYRWVEKILEAQVVNYGRRLLLEFVLPDPAALFRHAFDKGPTATDIQKPDVPRNPANPAEDLAPQHITEENYRGLVARYRVSGIEPPPEPKTWISLGLEQAEQPGDSRGNHFSVKRELKVPDGYRAVGWNASVQTWRNVQINPDGHRVVLSVGTSRQAHFPGPDHGESFTLNGALNNETGVLPVALMTDACRGYAINIMVECHRLWSLVHTWQQQVFEAVIGAYLQLKAEHDQALAALDMGSVAIQGRHPLENRRIEQHEMKRQVIDLLEPDLFSRAPGTEPVHTLPPELYPEPHLENVAAERDRIQFLEQAFEWTQMSYVFYPYYWAQKSDWLDAMQRADVDPQFAAFLQAGAARVIVPVRPNFERAAGLYLSTGIIWYGGPVPQVGDPLYVSAILEIQEQHGLQVGGTPVGDPWEVRLPTPLVLLQDDAQLPTFD